MTLRSALAFTLVGVMFWFVPELRSIWEFPVSDLVFLYFGFFWISQATSWNILSGYSGYFSFGQAAFFGAGVYTTVDLINELDVNFFITIPLAGVAGSLIGLTVGALAFRLRSVRGEMFALLTLAAALILATVARLSTFIDGGQGRRVPVPDYPDFFGAFPDLVFRLGMIVAIGSVAAAYAIQHSRFGRGLVAINGQEDVAESLGVPTFRYKMAAVAVTGFIAGASASVFALQVGFVTIGSVFGLGLPLFVIVMAVLGGRQHWLGPVIGAILVYTLRDRLTAAGLDDWNQIILGTVLAILVLFAPDSLYTRLKARPLSTAILFVLTMAAVTILGLADRLIDVFAWGLGVSVLGLLMPKRRNRLDSVASVTEEKPVPQSMKGES